MINSPVNTFQYASKALPYYKKILTERGVVSEQVIDMESFTTYVPILSKEEIFSRFSATDMSFQGQIPPFASAIVSSGTSGVFSFGLVSREDVERQRQMVDQMMDQFFDAKNHPPLIINLLAMGVSFVSSYPVVPTSVRTDIALQVVKNFGSDRPIVLIGDPHVLKKLLDEGVEAGLHWPDYQASVIVGGVWFSDSYARYVLNLLNGPVPVMEQKNRFFSTMGVTEVGLNIFAATPDLVYARSAIMAEPEARRVLTDDRFSCPILMYQLAPDVMIEVNNVDELGIGDLVITHLNTEVTPCLVRYKTGDRVKLVTPEELQKLGLTPLLPLPVYAIYGRVKVDQGPTTEAEVKELIYQDPDLSRLCTGHFIIESETDGKTSVSVQLKPQVELVSSKEVGNIYLNPVPYQDFGRDMEVSYEVKWKH